MGYVITDGSKYINGNAGIHTVGRIEDAATFEYDKAKNVLGNTLPKQLRKYNWKIVFVENNRIMIPTKQEEISYNIEDKVIEIEKFIRDLHERKEYLNKMQSEIDLEITDIEHAAEFYTLNAAQGYKIYKMLHDARNKRREIKNEMEQIKYILNANMKCALDGNISNTLTKFKNKHYNPRVLKELFNA